MLLPAIDGSASYRSLPFNVDSWLPAMTAICSRHGLPAQHLRRLSQGTNVVFAVEDRIVKLYPPHWRRLAEADRAVAVRVHGFLSLRTPEVHAFGTLEDWPYMVMSRLGGHPLHEVWKGLDDQERARLAAELGEALAQLHALPVTGMAELEGDWPRFIRERIHGCVARHRQQGASEAWLAQIPGFLALAAPLYPPVFQPAIVSGDVHDYHLMVENRAGRWHLSGLFDFDDARAGFREYDLAASGLFMFSGRPALLRTFLLAYGYPYHALDQALSLRLLAYTLLHRYRMLTWLLDEYVTDAPATLEQLAQSIYGPH